MLVTGWEWELARNLQEHASVPCILILMILCASNNIPEILSAAQNSCRESKTITSAALSQQTHRNGPAIPDETAIATLVAYAHAQTSHATSLSAHIKERWVACR